MKPQITLFLLSILIFGLFTLFSYTVAKEYWQSIDFDTTVKLQDHIPRDYDFYFSYFSLLGSAEVTVGGSLILAALNLFRWRWIAVLGWLVIIPASFFEVFGKLFVFHPGPPALFHRSILATQLPSFYVHTNFSYPSGHMIRSIFFITVFMLIIFFSRRDIFFRRISLSALIFLAFMMALTRVYLGEHWLSDVIGGGLLGVAAGLFAAIFIVNKKIA